MIAPERWYEYQREYQKYGLDMKPQPQERRTRSRKTRTRRKVVIPFSNGRKAAFSMVLLVGFAMIMLIIITAYSANVRYDVNNMIRENHVLMGEIENLQVKVYSANNVNYIEGKATGELKMKYPKSKNRVYLTMDDMPEQGFADIIRQKAYN